MMDKKKAEQFGILRVQVRGAAGALHGSWRGNLPKHTHHRFFGPHALDTEMVMVLDDCPEPECRHLAEALRAIYEIRSRN